jgi:hypothetical protein
MEKIGRNFEAMTDEGWVTDVAFFVDVTHDLNDLNKELQGKDKLTAHMDDNMKAFGIKLRM